MFLFNLFRGFIGFTKDIFRFLFGLLKRPHYVAFLIALFIGAFYFNGVPPHEISGVVSEKWNMFVENRKKTFMEDLQLFSKRFRKKTPDELEQDQKNALTAAKIERAKQAKEREERRIRQMREETFGWQQAIETAEKKQIPADENAVAGSLKIVGADRVRIADKTFSLKVRLRSGKAGSAYQDLQRRFDGRNGKCLPDKNTPEKADCFVGKTSLSQMLIDYAYADPI